MYKVITKFKDKYNPQHLYSVGDEFISSDEMRINDLLSRQLIKEVEKEVKDEGKKDKEVKAKKSKVKVGD